MGAMASVNEGRVDGRARETTEMRLLALFARLAIAVGFLSSVADRFGLWGPAGSAKVAWGTWNNFVAYTAVLNFFLPHWSAPILAVVVTIAETSLGILLISGLWPRWTAALKIHRVVEGRLESERHAHRHGKLRRQQQRPCYLHARANEEIRTRRSECLKKKRKTLT